jgi:hypothetical protein
VDGRQHLEGLKGPVVFASNHQSFMDTPVIMAALPGPWRYRLAPAMAKEFFVAHFSPEGHGRMLRPATSLIAFRSGRWEVGVASTSPSVSYASREGAIAIARKFSKVHHVDVWVSNGPSLECVASNRRHTKSEDDAKKSTPLAGMFSNKTT